ncbi:MAG TPA: DUF11 domain-containing protein, partial [Pyrinomonadaceae bacterium]|nr:DUF11 domain-containing protein [Pyrinomonadaceae bacterium]
PGLYPVAAVYTSGDENVLSSHNREILTVTPEDVGIVPHADNPTVLLATGGTFTGTINFCFDFSEPSDGSAGDTSLILGGYAVKIPDNGGLVGIIDLTHSGGGIGQPRTSCAVVSLKNVPPGTASITASTSGYYSGSLGTTFQVVDPATLHADLLVGLGVNNLNPRQGDLITYTITVRNFGPDTATNTIVNDVLSSGTTFYSANANRGAFTAPSRGQTGTVTWYLGDLTNGGQESAQIQVTVVVKGKTTITNTASVASSMTDPNTANNTASLTTSVVQGGNGGKH